MEERLDKVIMQRELVSTRVRAEQIIKESGVMVNGKLYNKPGKKIPVDAKIELLSEEIPYVSRGALKLKKALEEFKIDLEGKTILDLGSSTGGFTEVCLENNAQKVIAVDVGTDQLHPKLREDQRVVLFEQTHLRALTETEVPEPVDCMVMDLSFISLSKVFPFVHPFLKAGGDAIVLVKPQFEVGKEYLGKGGVVKKPTLYPKVLQDIAKLAELNHMQKISHTESPILGGDGNREFLMHLRKNP